MPYFQKRTLLGKYMEIEEYAASKNGRRLTRAGKEKPSSEAQRKKNERQAEKKLTRLMHCNFDEKDFFLTLTFKNKHSITEEMAEREFNNYIRRVKNIRNKNGISELRYIVVMGKDKKNGLHFHLVISGGMPKAVIESLWGKGRTMITQLEEGEHGFKGLAIYFLKNTKQLGDRPNKRKWKQSMKLEKPKVIKLKPIKRISMKKNPKAPKGYRVVDYDLSVNKFTGAMYRVVLCRRIE